MGPGVSLAMNEPWEAVREYLAQGKGSAQAVSAAAPPLVSLPELMARWEDADFALAGCGTLIGRFLAAPEVTDVLVNGTEIWVDRGEGVEETGLRLESSAQARDLAVRMAAAAGARLDEAAPIVDATLPDGTRLHAMLCPPAVGGPLISLRTQRRRAFSLEQLRTNGTLTDLEMRTVQRLVQCRASVILSGATGSGKTTLLSAILSSVSPTQRIICIEDVAELRPDHPHTVSITTRSANVQGRGQITLADLLRAAMRMRPDRIVLGECRGGEVREVLSALNTGHEGGWATIHANAASDVPARLVALGALAGMKETTVHAQALAALDAVIHVERRGGCRRLAQIAVFAAQLPLRVLPALTDGQPDRGWGHLEGLLQAREERC